MKRVTETALVFADTPWRVDDFGAEVPDTEAEVVTTARRVGDTLARVGELGEEVARLDVASSTHAPAS